MKNFLFKFWNAIMFFACLIVLLSPIIVVLAFSCFINMYFAFGLLIAIPMSIALIVLFDDSDICSNLLYNLC